MASRFAPALSIPGRRHGRRLNLGQYLQPGYHGPRWTAEQLALLGTLPAAAVAAIVGWSVNAVRVMRNRRGIPNAMDQT